MTGLSFREAGPHAGAGLVVHLHQHFAGPVERGEHIGAVVGNEALDDPARRPQVIADRLRGARSTPSPVAADTATESGCVRRVSASISRVHEVGLVPRDQHRHVARRRSRASTVLTASMRPSTSGPLASTRCSSRSASATSSSVDRNASTSWCGRRRTKPTVSEMRIVSPPGSAGGGSWGRASRTAGSPRARPRR